MFVLRGEKRDWALVGRYEDALERWCYVESSDRTEEKAHLFEGEGDLFAAHCGVLHVAGPRVLLHLQPVLQRSPGDGGQSPLDALILPLGGTRR